MKMSSFDLLTPSVCSQREERMRGHLVMSQKERQRLGPIARAAQKEITLAQAARQLGLSYKQAGRILKRFQQEGDLGLVHRARGQPSTHRTDQAIKEEVLTHYRNKYAGYAPTYASEKLAERDGIKVHRETLR